MTRIIFFGDLHANWEAWLALRRAEQAPDAVFCLGDIVGYGPDPQRCLAAVRTWATGIIQGGHDRAVGRYGRNGPIADNLLAESWCHTAMVLTEPDRHYLANLPPDANISWGGARLHLARLEPDDDRIETYTLITAPAAKLRERFAHIEADVILLGGAHVPAMRQIDGRLFICPGSLGFPRYGVSDPTFAVWQDGDVRIHHLHYHPDQTIQKLALLPLEPENRLWLEEVLRTGDRQ
jgi:predicted phosphodiesterase